MDSRILLITQLIKMGAAAAIAAALVRSWEFKSRLFKENRTLAETIQLTIFIATPFALGVVVRLWVKNFLAADLAFEGALIMGVMGGRFAGVLGGLLVSLPAAFGHHEWLAVPFDVGTGLAAGVLRQVAAKHEDIWSFSPFIDLSVYQWIRRNLPRPRIDWQISFFFVIVALRIVLELLARAFPNFLFAVTSERWTLELAAYATSVVCIAVPLKIWNSARMELKLQEQQRMLMQARMEALQSQINPHFLFNTLNTVSSLVRFDPDTARDIIVKLASILRRLLRTHEQFVTLREEVEFIDDYLDIEVVRFGRDKLRVVKELEPETLEIVVPSMLLQPLVENSIKHGLSPKVDGGSITLRSRVQDGSLIIEVADDGVGIGYDGPVESTSTGIGMANIAGRLKVLYGEGARMIVASRDAQGTLVSLCLPILHSAEPGDDTAAAAGARVARR